MNKRTAYRAAAAQADESRARFRATLGETRQRIAPARLKSDARQKAAAMVINAGHAARAEIRQRPIATGAAAGALVLWLAHRPIGALFHRLYVRFKTRNSETDDG